MFSKIKRHLLAILSVCMLLEIAVPLSEVIAQENDKIEDSSHIRNYYEKKGMFDNEKFLEYEKYHDYIYNKCK